MVKEGRSKGDPPGSRPETRKGDRPLLVHLLGTARGRSLITLTVLALSSRFLRLLLASSPIILDLTTLADDGQL